MLATFDQLFDDALWRGGFSLGKAGFSPAIDVRSNDEAVVIEVDVPGVKQEDLNVSCENDVLTISGKREYVGGDKDKVWLQRSFGSFKKAYTLPAEVDSEQMQASLDNGVLTITVPKRARARPRQIPILSQ